MMTHEKPQLGYLETISQALALKTRKPSYGAPSHLAGLQTG